MIVSEMMHMDFRRKTASKSTLERWKAGRKITFTTVTIWIRANKRYKYVCWYDASTHMHATILMDILNTRKASARDEPIRKKNNRKAYIRGENVCVCRWRHASVSVCVFHGA